MSLHIESLLERRWTRHMDDLNQRNPEQIDS